MNKKIYYLCGLPRSGKTLFGSILNQNPRARATANSIVLDILWQIENLKNHRTFLNFPDHKSFNNVVGNIISNYYQDWDYDFILDRSSWGSPNNLEILENNSPNEIKFVLLVRNIENVVASFVRWSEENKPNFLDNETDGTVRSKCEYLMRSDSQMIQSYCSTFNIINSKHPYYLIQYDEFVKEPQKTLDGLYEFLGTEGFQHSFNHIEQFNCNEIFYDDTVVGKNLHTIKTNEVSINQYDLNKYIPEDLINYFTTLNFWK